VVTDPDGDRVVVATVDVAPSVDVLAPLLPLPLLQPAANKATRVMHAANRFVHAGVTRTTVRRARRREALSRSVTADVPWQLVAAPKRRCLWKRTVHLAMTGSVFPGDAHGPSTETAAATTMTVPSAPDGAIDPNGETPRPTRGRGVLLNPPNS
jgi:hypothetical protein